VKTQIVPSQYLLQKLDSFDKVSMLQNEVFTLVGWTPAAE